MEPNKLDLDIKQKLESRTIQPSAQAWNRLEAMLDTAEKTKNKRKYNWIYIAASFIGFLLVCTVFFNGFGTEKINKDFPIVLEEKIDADKSAEPEIISEDVLPRRIQQKTIKEYKVVVDNNNLKKQPKQLESKKEEVSIINPSKGNDVQVISSENKIYTSTNSNRYVSAEKLLAEVSNTKLEFKATDGLMERTRKGVSINPNSLLSNAENEMNQSFRTSALDKFNKSFNAIKTVLANRNYEE